MTNDQQITLDPETRADLDQLWYTIETYVRHDDCDVDECERCEEAENDGVRAVLAYQRIQETLKAWHPNKPQGGTEGT